MAMAEWEETKKCIVSIFGQDNITLKDFETLKPKFVQKVYSLILKDIGTKCERFLHLPFNAPDDVKQHQELYTPTYYIFSLAKVVNYYLAKFFNTDDFTVGDLINPVNSRTHIFFAKMLDIFLEYNKIQPLMQSVHADVESRRKHKQDLLDSIEKSREQLHRGQLAQAEAEIVLDKERSSLESMTAAMTEKQEMSADLKRQRDDQKENILQLRQCLQDLELDHIKANENKAQLESQVLMPEEIEEMNNVNAEVTSRKESIAQSKKKLRYFQKNMEEIEKSLEIVSNVLLPALLDIEEEVKRKPEILAKDRTCDNELAQMFSEEEEIMRRLQRLNEEINTLMEKRTGSQHSLKLKVQGFDEELKQLKLTAEERNRGREEHHIVTRDIGEEIEETKKLVLNEQESLKKYKVHLNTFLKRLTEEVYRRSALELERANKENVKIQKVKKDCK